MEEPEDKMSNRALHERLQRVEVIVWRCSAFLAAVGYFSGKIAALFRFLL